MSTRMRYTRWERDRLGKLRLGTGEYSVIGEEVPFRLERAPLRRAALAEYAAGFCATVIWASVAFVVALDFLGCASADVYGYPPESLSPEALPTFYNVVLAAIAPEPLQKTLLLDPADEVRELTTVAAEHFREHGFAVETGPGGIPVTVADEVTYRGVPVDGRSHYDGWCFYDGCNSGAIIVLSRGMLTGKPQIAQHSLEHEIAHIVSGWGACVQADDALPMADGMHLSKGHLVSNGNEHYELVDWTADDIALMMTCIVNGGRR